MPGHRRLLTRTAVPRIARCAAGQVALARNRRTALAPPTASEGHARDRCAAKPPVARCRCDRRSRAAGTRSRAGRWPNVDGRAVAPFFMARSASRDARLPLLPRCCAAPAIAGLARASRRRRFLRAVAPGNLRPACARVLAVISWAAERMQRELLDPRAAESRASSSDHATASPLLTSVMRQCSSAHAATCGRWRRRAACSPERYAQHPAATAAATARRRCRRRPRRKIAPSERAHSRPAVPPGIAGAESR